MEINKDEILKRVCYTELVYGRIRKKLLIDLSDEEIEKLISSAIAEAPVEHMVKRGKNFYISNNSKGIRITINSNTTRIITVDKISL